MSDENPNLDVKATLDVNSVTANAPVAASSLRDVAASEREMGEAAEASSEQAERLTKAIQAQRAAMMQTVFQAHRLMEGFKDISEGGRLASQGFVDLEETLARFLPPMAQVGLALVSAAGLLAVIATHHRRAAGEAKEHADAEKDAAQQVTDAWAQANSELDASLKDIESKKFWSQQLDQAKQLTEEIGLQAKAYETVQSAQAKLLKATQDLEIAQLNQQEQADLAGKSGEDEAFLKDKYASLRAEATAKNEQERNRLELERAQHERDQLVREGVAKQTEVDAATTDAQVAYEKAHQEYLVFMRQLLQNTGGKSDYDVARDRMEALANQKKWNAAGYADPETDQAVPPLTVAQQIDLANLQNGGVESLRQKEVQAGHGLYDEQYAAAKKERDEIEKASSLLANGDTIKGMNAEETAQQVQAWSDRAAALGAYMKQIETYNNLLKQVDEADEKRNKAYIANRDFQVENKAKIDAANLNVQTVETEGKTIDVNRVTGVEESFNKAIDTSTKERRQIRDNNLEARIAALEEQLKNADESHKGQYETMLGVLKAEQEKNKAADELAGLTLEPAVAASVRNKANAIEGNDATNSHAQAEKKAAETAEEKETREKIENIEGQIRATGSAPMIKAMERVIDLFRGKVDEASQLQELTQLTGILAGDYAAFKIQTGREIQKLRHSIDGLRNNHQS